MARKLFSKKWHSNECRTLCGWNSIEFSNNFASYAKSQLKLVSVERLCLRRFLVGAFLVKSARLLQWLVFFISFFFRQTTDLIAYVPLFTDFTLAHMYSSVLGLR